MNSQVEIEHKTRLARLERTALLWRTIRDVTQLTNRETGLDRLLCEICRTLTEHGGYVDAWAVVWPQEGSPDLWADAFAGPGFQSVVEGFLQKKLPECAARAVESRDIVVTRNPIEECSGCSLAGTNHARGALTAPLRRKDKTFGVLCVSVPVSFVHDADEVSLLGEIAAEFARAVENRRSAGLVKRWRNRYHGVINGLPFPLSVVGVDYRYLSVNDAFARSVGMQREDIAGRAAAEVMDETDFHTKVKPSLDRCFGGESVQYEGWFVEKGEKTVYRRITYHPYYGENEVPEGAIVHAYDLTALKQTEHRLRVSEERFRSIFEKSPVGIAIVDTRNQALLETNESFQRLSGYTEKEIQKLTVQDITHPEDWAQETEMIREHLANRKPGDPIITKYDLEKRYIDKNQNIVWVRVSGDVIRLPQLEFPVAVANVQNITDRKHAETALKKSEEKFRSFVENANDIVYSLTPEGIFTYVSPNWIEHLGHRPEEVVGKSFAHFVHPEDVSICRAFLRGVIETKTKQSSMEYRALHKNGGIRWHVSNGSPIMDKEQQMVTYIGIARDVTERKAFEEQLQRLATAVGQLNEMIVITDPAGNIQYVNPAFEKTTGYAQREVLGQNPRLLKSGAHDDIFYSNLWNTINNGKTWRGRIVNKKKNGDLYTEETAITPVVDSRGEIINFVAVKRDITDILHLEIQLQQSQKMEAIGTLAGGIAHDFNNLLFPIFGYAEMMLDDLPENSDLRNNVREILTAAGRAKELVRQILKFSRKSEQEMKPLLLHPVIKESLKLLRATIPTSIAMHQDIRQTGPVNADPTQIHQIIINLCTNAHHAMEDTEGAITVTLKETEIHPSSADHNHDIHPGTYAEIIIADTGVGMDENTRERIFDPYFTTKGQGKGTGLGLAVVHGIVREHGGFIKVDSTPGKGTAFHIFFPIVHVEIFNRKQTSPGLLPPGNEHILVVDDEAHIVDMYRQMLSRLGYQVTVRYNSLDALALFQTKPREFDLVLTDMAMPNMSGDRLAQRIMEIRGDIPVIICTGYSEQIDARKAEALGLAGFLLKPVITGDMAVAVRNALDKRTAASQ